MKQSASIARTLITRRELPLALALALLPLSPCACSPTGGVEDSGSRVDVASPRANGTLLCSSSSCELRCHDGFASCNSNTDDGCEVDLRTSVNCGACGRRCAAGETCNAGLCGACASPPCGPSADGGMMCPSGQSLCGAACVDVSSANEHCGQCDRRCPTGSICQSGLCACSAGMFACPSGCVDLATDPRNCGVCGLACGAGQRCMTAMCR